MVLGNEFRERARPFVFPLKVFVVLTALFIFFEAVGLAHALETLPFGKWSPSATFAMSLALFSLDSVLPVPATIVGYANGHGLGLILGSFGNILGIILGSLVEYAIGAASGKPEDLTPEKPRFRSLVWIAVSRWIPLASETTAIVAGRRRILLLPFLTATILGAAPGAITLAYLGSTTGF